MNSSSAQRMTRVRESLSWRGPFLVALLAVREVLRPLFYWHVWRVFETDITGQVSQPYGKQEVEVKVYSSNDRLAALSKQISAMGELEPAEVSRRFAQGWLVAIAFVKERPVGYVWIVLSTGFELAFDTFWIVRSGEALRHGAFVLPAFRGQGIHSSLNHAVVCYLRERNMHTALACVSLLNAHVFKVFNPILLLPRSPEQRRAGLSVLPNLGFSLRLRSLSGKARTRIMFT